MPRSKSRSKNRSKGRSKSRSKSRSKNPENKSIKTLLNFLITKKNINQKSNAEISICNMFEIMLKNNSKKFIQNYGELLGIENFDWNFFKKKDESNDAYSTEYGSNYRNKSNDRNAPIPKKNNWTDTEYGSQYNKQIPRSQKNRWINSKDIENYDDKEFPDILEWKYGKNHDLNKRIRVTDQDKRRFDETRHEKVKLPDIYEWKYGKNHDLNKPIVITEKDKKDFVNRRTVLPNINKRNR